MMPGISQANNPQAAMNSMLVDKGVKIDITLRIQHINPPMIIGLNLKIPPVMKVGIP